jgi:hypothetical protein
MNLTLNRPLLMMAVAFGVLSSTHRLLAAPDFPSVPSVYTRYAADNPANVTVPPLSQTFATTAVDLTNGKLAIPNIGFSVISYPNGIGPATPVYFSSTGTLPAPLKPNTPYYVVPADGGGYKVFPVAVDADAPFQPGGVLGEKVLPAQNVSQGVQDVAFTSAGAGTHTLYTETLIKQMTDMTANGFHSVAVNGADKHTLLEVVEDANGKKFIRTAGATARENYLGSYNAYGQTFVQSPGDKRFAARQQVGSKRVIYQIFVGKVRSYKERQVAKFLADPAKVLPATDEITFGIEPRLFNKVETGDLITVKAYEGTTLPAPLMQGTDYYARKIDKKNLTLHPTATDAANNTNVIDLTTSGSGSFLFTLPQRVGDSRRWSFFAEVLEPGPKGGNTLSARLQEPIPQGGGILKNATAFTVSGRRNGNIAGLAAVPDLSPVVLWTPQRAALPAPLKAGVTYWISKSGSAVRLHESLASAKESLEKPTDTSSCIKYTTAGNGESLVSYDDSASAIAYGTLGGMVTFAKRVPLGPMCILVFKIDYNDPTQPSASATLGVNESVTEQQLLKLARALTPEAVNDKSHAWTMFNSAQGHVPIDLDCYEVIFGSSAEAVPDSQIQAMVDYFKTKYSITN